MNNSHDYDIKDSTFGLKQIEIDPTRFETEPDPNCLPILPTRNLVMFPGTNISFELTRASSKRLAKEANQHAFPIGIVCQLDPQDESPEVPAGVFKYGVVADVLSVMEDDEHSIAIVRARNRFRILGKVSGSGEDDTFVSARVRFLTDQEPQDTTEYSNVCAEIRRNLKSITSMMPQQVTGMLARIQDDTEFVNYCCTNIPIETEAKVELLSKTTLKQRAVLLLSKVLNLVQQQEITDQIMKRTRASMDEQKRNAFLQQQMEAIRETLYGDDDEVEELLARGEEAQMPDEVWELFQKEINKLRRYNPSTPDYSVLYSYLETLIALPWVKATPRQTDFDAARQILDESHYGLEKVKERILEQLAQIIRSPRSQAPILCLVGATGVGKTSIGRAVAKALGRVYERVSFGGLHDEAEIRGHRRTYIGAMPGRIIDAMKRAGTVNPVLVLDEVDKIGADYKGDPGAALLEVLDPEQNCHFHDNYIDVDYDLSNVLFIATANTLGTISRPLLDRMEIIELPGYLLEEKVEIAKRHLLPAIMEKMSLTSDNFAITNEAIEAVIRDYTSESGVRALDKKLAAIARKVVLAIMKGDDYPMPIGPDDLYGLLGLAPHIADRYEGNDFAGVVTGLAWTEVGGEILMVESSLARAKNPGLTLTGKLGTVMQESATIAYQWVKAHADRLGINYELFDRYNLHIHFPEGAIPKDGPSAGITIATSIVSTFTQRRVAERIAMTGEITLRGKVLPVGGIREKILAAKRAGIDTIILSQQNRRDIEDIPAAYTAGMTFRYVDTVDEVIAFAVTDQPVARPVEL